ncbi:VOC family protein [Aeromicrobium sp. CF3.5]|uniref:VOC family protein n=1 Tax=Aeromicrobium sp. CF3.5 TaxID=3373078 RepID=UPI003EE5F059
MALVTWQNLCIDASDAPTVAAFWARVLEWEAGPVDADGDVTVSGGGPGETIVVLAVPESRSVKQRVHLDLRAESLDRFGGLDQLSEVGDFSWTVFADPEGGELCVFTYDTPPAHRLKAVGIDSADHVAISQWWADVLGGTLTHSDDGYSHLDDIAGSTLESMDFAPVPEPKTVKNRIHWDVTLTGGATVGDLVAAGAVVLRPQDHEITWTVMADPEGNEFCVFGES